MNQKLFEDLSKSLKEAGKIQRGEAKASRVTQIRILTSEEKMRQISNYPNYAITKDGRVWSIKRKKYLTPETTNKYGYQRVCLYNNKKKLRVVIHRLVLEIFIGPCPSGYGCRHLDGNSTNNNLSNLRWGTHKENGKDTQRHGSQKGIKNGQAKLVEQDVRMIVYMYRTGDFTQQEIAKIYGVTRPLIGNIINRKNWKHIWSK